ncbi:signal recognition particle subunit FFH/SRP54 (srp54) [Mycoplasma testudineum]|uniref:Signal recognition particle protein n=2 Tax=Mycoplasma testudineum TaxID=244584 RepID=A0A4R6IDW6_9MOLU|nr:signal recognition particle protein [Mycoplasma testudineum]OYD26723.1 signal recognition particle protein [Mycoplasma testudineum]TDO19807.1 signal recognition particle subunit FFH/SRP54 (srp54) [Mycoplasma testudineum]
MLEFLGKRIQKSLDKVKTKTVLSESDILEVTKEIKFALLEADVNLSVVKTFIKAIKDKVLEQEVVGKLNPSQTVIKIVDEELTRILGKKPSEIKVTNKPFKIMMVGLQGGGKTTTSAKLANYFRKKKQVENPLLVGADIYRPAAIEQLKILSKQINVDFFDNGTDVKPDVTAAESLDIAYKNKNDLIILDTAGRLSINEELMIELETIKKVFKPNEIIYVVDALSGQEVINVMKTFHERLNLTGAIITKLDSDARGGTALSIKEVLDVPIKYIGTGEKINNLDLFYPDRMSQRILGMGDVLSLIEKAEEVIDQKDAKKMMNRMFSGEYTIDDLMNNLKQIRKLGKMSALIKMIPGLSKKISSAQIDEAEEKIKLFEIIISSMTIEERKNPKLLKNASRKQRIINGSGRNAQEYNRLIIEFDRMQKQVKALGENLKGGGGIPGLGNF